MLPLGTLDQSGIVLSETTSTPASRLAQSLAKNLRLFGWIGFWVQSGLAVISAPLLAFATSGRAFSPGSVGFGDAIYWGDDAFFLLCFAVLLALYYTRAAKKVARRPDMKTGPPFGFLVWHIGLLGVFLSFTGVALGMLLIAKTVSQHLEKRLPILILDVFVLLGNFNLLVAHFIGMGLSLWLSIGVSKARLAYMTIRGRIT